MLKLKQEEPTKEEIQEQEKQSIDQKLIERFAVNIASRLDKTHSEILFDFKMLMRLLKVNVPTVCEGEDFPETNLTEIKEELEPFDTDLN